MMKTTFLFLTTVAFVEAFVVVPTDHSPATALKVKSLGDEIAGYCNTLVASAKKWQDESARAREVASVHYREILESSSQKWTDEKAQALEEAHSQYHAILETAADKWAQEKDTAASHYRKTLHASALKWEQEKALAEAEAGVAYRRKLDAATQKWNEEQSQKDLQDEIGSVVFKTEKKVNEAFMDKELHVHDSLWNEIEHSLESDPYFRF